MEENNKDYISLLWQKAHDNGYKQDEDYLRDKLLNDDEYRRLFHEKIQSQGYKPDYNEFSSRIGITAPAPHVDVSDVERPSYEEWYKTVPQDRSNTENYDLKRAYESLPYEQMEKWRTATPEQLQEEAYHLPSVSYNEEKDEYTFLKSKDHKSLKNEIDWYNSNDPEAVEFRKKYDLDTTGDYYKYVPKVEWKPNQIGGVGGDYNYRLSDSYVKGETRAERKQRERLEMAQRGYQELGVEEYKAPEQFSQDSYNEVLKDRAKMSEEYNKLNGEYQKWIHDSNYFQRLGGSSEWNKKKEEDLSRMSALQENIDRTLRYEYEYLRSPEGQEYLNRYEEYCDQMDALIQEAGGDNYTALGRIGSAFANTSFNDIKAKTPEEVERDVKMATEGNQLIKAKRDVRNARRQLRMTRERINGDYSGFRRGWRATDVEGISSINAFADNMTQLGLAKKVREGKELSKADEVLLAANQLKAEVDWEYASSNTMGERIGMETAAQLVTTGEFLIGSGLTGSMEIAGAVSKNMMGKMGVKMAENAVIRESRNLLRAGVAEGIGMAAGAAVQTFANPISYLNMIADYADKRTGSIYFDEKDGQIHYFDDEKSVVLSLWQAAAGAYVENLTEFSGAGLDKLGKIGLEKLYKAVPELEKAVGSISGLLDKVKFSEITGLNAPAMDEYLRHAGFNGTLGEYGEEVLGNIIRPFMYIETEKGDSYGKQLGRGMKRLIDADQNLETFLSCAVTGVFLGASATARNSIMQGVSSVEARREYRDNIAKLDAMMDDVRNLNKEGFKDYVSKHNITEISQYIKDQAKENNWSEDELGLVAQYVVNVAAQQAYANQESEQIKQAVKELSETAKQQVNKWDGEHIYNVTFTDPKTGEVKQGAVVNGRMHYTQNEDGSYKFNPYTSSGMLAIRLSDGSGVVQVSARQINSLDNVMTIDEQLALQGQTVRGLLEEQFKQDDVMPTVESAWGFEFEPGVTEIGGRYTFIGKDEDGNYQFQDSETKTKEGVVVTMSEDEVVAWGLRTGIAMIQNQQQNEAAIEAVREQLGRLEADADLVDELDEMKKYSRSVKSDGFANWMWKNLQNVTGQFVIIDDNGLYNEEKTTPKDAAVDLYARNNGDMEAAKRSVVNAIHALSSQAEAGAMDAAMASTPSAIANTAASAESSANTERAAKQIAFLEQVGNVLGMMEQRVEELKQNEIENTPVSQMEVGAEFPVVINGVESVAKVENKDNGRNVVSIYDKNDNPIQVGIDDWTDEQWQSYRVKPQAEQPVQEEKKAEEQKTPVETVEPVENVEPENVEEPQKEETNPLDAFIAKHGAIAQHKLEKTVEAINKEIDGLEKALAKAEKKLEDMPEPYDEKTQKAQDAQLQKIEKLKNELESKRQILAPYASMMEEMDKRVATQQAILKEADEVLNNLDAALNPVASTDNQTDREPASREEAAADYLVGFVKKSARINEPSLKQESGWSDEEAKRFRPATTPDGGVSLMQAAESLYSEYEGEGHEHGWFTDPKDAMNALLEAMKSTGDYKGLANYIKDNRNGEVEEAQRQHDQAANQLGYADAQDMHDKIMAEARRILESHKDQNGNLTQEGLQQFKDEVAELTRFESVEPAPVVESEIPEEFAPTSEEAPFSVSGKTNEQIASEYQKQLEDAKTEADRAAVIQGYLDAIGTEPAVVMTNDNYKQILSENGFPKESLVKLELALKDCRKHGEIFNAFKFKGNVYMFSEDQKTVEDARTNYVHERQHILTVGTEKGLYLLSRIMNSASTEELQKYVELLSGSDFYTRTYGGKPNAREVYADEVISMAMEYAYNGEDLDSELGKLGIRQEIINEIKQLDNEQRTNKDLAAARRTSSVGESEQRNNRQNAGNQGSRPREVGGQRPGSSGRSGGTAGKRASVTGEVSLLPVDKQTPKNTTIDQVLYSIKVNHNSPTLIKKADGSFVDPETGERLGFDHRFMGTGEGGQAHGWGSYFSINDIRSYGGSPDYIYNSLYKGKVFPKSDLSRFAQSFINRYDGNIDAARSEIERLLNFYKEKGLTYINDYGEHIPFDEARKAIEQLGNKEDFDIAQRHHYSVEIPDDNGNNYIDERKKPSVEDLRRVVDVMTDEEKSAIEPAVRFEKVGDNVEVKTIDDLVGTLNSYIENDVLKDLYEVALFIENDGFNSNPKEASRLLHDAGFVGIHYDGQRDGECYVIFDENDAHIVDHVRFSVEAENKKETSSSERSGVFSGNSSSEGLHHGSNGHLSRTSVTSHEDAAKIQKNTETSLRSAKKTIREGGIKNDTSTPENAVRALGKTLHLHKSNSSMSYYREYYEGDFNIGNDIIHVRISTHPATGERMGNYPADDKVSIVIRKNGEHRSNEPHNGYVEYVYEPSEISPTDAANAIVRGFENLIKTGDFKDDTNKAHRQEYPYLDENGEIRFSVTSPAEAEEDALRYSVVTDPKLIEELESGEKIKVFRAMQLVDGKLYPPMAGKVNGEWQNPIEIGVWEQADERPEMADSKGYFVLDKGNGKKIKARYNPYIHTSRSPLNDQFTSAYDRPNLVTVEVEVPASELTSGYKAENAKDAVGEMTWHAGPVSGKLPNGKKRKVILTRYDKPVRIVPDREVALRIADLLNGEDIAIPYNVVTPSLRKELEGFGVNVSPEPNGNVRYSVSGYNPRAYVPKVRGGWTEKKILRYLKENHANTGLNKVSTLIAEFDSPEELKDHMFYHGTTKGSFDLKPSITMSDRDIERLGGGGYGAKYWGISLSKSKKVSSNFSGTSRYVRIFPVVLAKNAKVIERQDFQDAADLEDHIIELWEQGVDAVWIGKGKQGEGEQELCVINPKAIAVAEFGDYYDVYKMAHGITPLNIASDEDIANIYKSAKEYVERRKHSPVFLEPFPELSDYESREAYEQAKKDREKRREEFKQSKEYQDWLSYKRDAENALRFSVSGTHVIDNGETLVGLHNLNADKLRKVLKQGGMANPSAAVIDIDRQDHFGYGDISLIMPSRLVDSRTGNNAGTYAGDAYTPTYPSVSYREGKQTAKRIDALTKGLPESLEWEISRNIGEYMEGNSSRSGLEYIFLKDKGQEMPIVKNERRYPNISMDEIYERLGVDESTNRGQSGELYAAYEKLEGDKLFEFNLWYMEKGNPEDMQKYRDYIASNDKIRDLLMQRFGEHMPFSEFDNIWYGVFRDEYDAGKENLTKTLEDASIKVDELGLRDEYEQWKQKTIDGLGYEEVIFAGYNRDGYRKYIPNTVENASRLMNKQEELNPYNEHGLNPTRSGLLAKMKTLSDIRKNKHLLVTTEVYGERQKEVSDKLFDIVQRLSKMQKIDDNPYINNDYAESRLAEAIVTKDPIGYLNKEYGYDIDKDGDFAADVRSFIEEAKQLPAKYFETKFRRPVYLSEFAAAVVPQDLSQDLKDGLQQSGLKLYEYDKNTEGSRREVTLKATEGDNIRFSVANGHQEIFVSNAGRAVEGIKQEKATPEQWLKMLEKNGGLKAGEDKWLGLSEWLKGSDAKTLTKGEVLAFIAENKIQIEEETYGDLENNDLRPLQDKFEKIYDELRDQFYEEGNYDSRERAEAAFDELSRLYNGGDDFRMAFYIEDTRDGYMIRINDENAAGYFLDKKPINETRIDYTTEGLYNKREIALTVPTIEPWNGSDEIHFGDAGEGRAIAWIRFGEAYPQTEIEHPVTGEMVKVTDSRSKVLVIDEIQSKRHQEGREKGYKKGTKEDVRKANEATVDAQIHYDTYISDLAEKYNCDRADVYSYATDAEIEEAEARMEAVSTTMRAYEQTYQEANGIPTAPFEKNWMELAMKRMLRLAAEEGYDKVAWTTGEQQSMRYGYQIDYITRNDTSKSKNKGIRKYTFVRNGVEENIFVDNDGIIVATDKFFDDVSGKKLSEYLGKTIADKMMAMKDGERNEGGYVMTGEEGMKGFYDKMLVSFMNKYCKQWGVKVGEVTMPQLQEGYQTMHSVDVTPEMKASVMEGQLMFSVKSENDKQLSLFLQNNSNEYETQDGEKIGFASLLPFAESNNSVLSGRDNRVRGKENTDPTTYRLRKLDEGETCYIERKYEESKQFDFTGSEKIESADDVAYIFRKLEDAAVENSFIVLVKDGIPTIIHTGMGSYAETYVATGTAMVAYKNINPDKVYFIHNHPSGNVTRSPKDIESYKRFKLVFGNKLQPGIIIDTTSGVYGTFTEDEKEENNMPGTAKNEVPLKTYTFSKQVFDPSWNPKEAFKVSQISDVAAFISAQRLGEHKKMGLLLLNNSNRIVGNIFLPYTDLNEVPKGNEFSNEIGYYAQQMGATGVIVFGNYDIDGTSAKRVIKKLRNGLLAQNIVLLDVQNIGDFYSSAAQKGYLAEPQEEYSADTRYSISAKDSDRASVRDEFDKLSGAHPSERAKTLLQMNEQFLTDQINKFRPLKQLEGVLEKSAGRKLRDSESIYSRATTMAARTLPQMDAEKSIYLLPLTQAVNKVFDILDPEGDRISTFSKHPLKGAREKMEELRRRIGDYLIAKHGLERNEWFISNGKEDGDYSGLRGLAESLGENPDDFKAVAERVVAEFESEVGQTEIDNLWKEINSFTGRLLELSYNNGFSDKAHYDELKARWKYYVPLRGFSEGTSDDLYYYTTQGSDSGNANLTAHGRTSKADDPLTQLVRMQESAVMMGNENWAKQALYNLAINVPNDLLRVRNVYYTEDPNTGEIIEHYADISGLTNPDDIDAAIKKFEADMKAAGAKRKLNKADVGKKIRKINLSEHEIELYVNGKKVVVEVNGNPSVVRAYGESERKLSNLVRGIQKANRLEARLFTTWNPEFAVKNMMRDTRFALFSAFVTGKKGEHKMWKMRKNIDLSRRVLVHLMKDGSVGPLVKDATLRSNLEQWYKEFVENGGETGFTRTMSAEQVSSDINDTLRALAKGNEDGRTKVEKLFWSVEQLNRWAENSTRFAAYITARQSGKSARESLDEAKNSTLNFNIKGYEGKTLRAWFAFFNARLQGVAQLARLAKHNSKRFAIGLSACVLQGAIIPFLNTLLIGMFGDDDDWLTYEYMSEYTANNNMVVFIPGTHKFVTIPYSQELAPFSAIGNIWFREYAGMNHNKSAWQQMGEMALGYLPVEVSLSDKKETGDFWLSTLTRTLSPTILQPAVEYMNNENFMNTPLRHDNQWNTYNAAWTKAYENRTSSALIKASKWLNGGSGMNKWGAAEILIDPTFVQHVIEGTAGGVGSFFGNARDLFTEPDWFNHLPFVRKFMFDSDPKKYQGSIDRAYAKFAFDFVDEQDQTVKRIMEEKNETRDFVREYLAEHDSTNQSIYGIVKEYKENLGKYKAKRRDENGKEYGQPVVMSEFGNNPYRKKTNGVDELPITGIDGIRKMYNDLRTNDADQETIDEWRGKLTEYELQMLEEIDAIYYRDHVQGKKPVRESVRKLVDWAREGTMDNSGEE